MANLGIDFACVGDISPALTATSGRRGLIESIARRLITPRGGLFYAPDYGFDTRQYLSGITASPSVIAAGVIAEAEKDERVDQANAVVTFIGETLNIRLEIADGFGPFTFVLSVSKVTVEILKG